MYLKQPKPKPKRPTTSAAKQTKLQQKKGLRRLSLSELRTIDLAIVSILAGIAIVMKVQDPAVWTFLGMAAGLGFGSIGKTG
jgi:hypothetical protein